MMELRGFPNKNVKNNRILYSNENSKTEVYFHNSQKFGKNDFIIWAKDIEEDCECYIIIINKPSPDALTSTQQFSISSGIFIQLFTHDELSFNPRDNILVPKHTLLSQQQKEELLISLNISTKQLPKIKITDPQAKFLGAKINDIIKIERNSFILLNETIPFYRVVIE